MTNSSLSPEQIQRRTVLFPADRTIQLARENLLHLDIFCSREEAAVFVAEVITRYAE